MKDNIIRYKKKKFKLYQFRQDEDPCFLCYNEPVYIKSRKLGRRCYLRLRRKITLPPKPKFPIHRRQKTASQNMAKKYGEEILIDFELLKTKPFWNLTEVSKKYGFTRERARQMYNMLYGKGYIDFSKAKTKKIKKELEYCTNDPRYKVAEYTTESNVGKGAEAELIFYNICKDLKYKINTLCDNKIDININGFFVDVKSCFSPKKTCEHGPVYGRFKVTEHQKNHVDIVACYHAIVDTFYIVPIDEFPKNGTIYIAEKPSNHILATNRFEPYKEAWHLLEPHITSAEGEWHGKAL